MDNYFRRKCNFIYDIDLFGKEPELYYKGKLKQVSWIGRFFTILYFALYIIIFMYKFIKMIQKKEISFYETYAYTGDIPSINITNENFYGGFTLGATPYIDETIYYPKIEYWKGKRINGEWSWESKIVEYNRCKLDDFDPRYHELFKDKPLNNMYCLQNLNLTLDGYSYSDIYSYFNVTIYSCQNTTKDGIPCKDPLIIDNFFKENLFHFYIQDIELTPQYYYSPIQIGQKIISSPIYKDLYNIIYAYMQIINVETDLDFIGLNAFSKFKTDKFLKYYESWIIASPIEENKTYDKGYPLCEIIIQLSDRVLTQKRTYVKLIEIFGDVGGSMEFIFTVFNIISSFLTRTLYMTDLVNNLFSFNIEKKIIIIKNNEIDKLLLNKKFKNQIEPLPKNSQKNINNINCDKTSDRQNINNNQILNESLLLGRTVKISKRVNKKSRTSLPISFSKNKEIKNKNILKNNLQKENINNRNTLNEFDFSNNNINNENEKIKERDKNIINQIEINKLYFFLCYLCFKNRKNINN